MAPHQGSPRSKCMYSRRFWTSPTGVWAPNPSSVSLTSAPTPCSTSTTVGATSANCSVIGWAMKEAGSTAAAAVVVVSETAP